MSHFTEVKTEFKNKEILKNALQFLGHEIVENSSGNPVEVRGFFGDTIPAEFKFETKSKYDVGFILDEQQNYQVIGDWELLPTVAKIEKDIFVNKLKQAYAFKAIEQVALEKGHTFNYQMNENNEMEITLTSWS